MARTKPIRARNLVEQVQTTPTRLGDEFVQKARLAEPLQQKIGQLKVAFLEKEHEAQTKRATESALKDKVDVDRYLDPNISKETRDAFFGDSDTTYGKRKREVKTLLLAEELSRKGSGLMNDWRVENHKKLRTGNQTSREDFSQGSKVIKDQMIAELMKVDPNAALAVESKLNAVADRNDIEYANELLEIDNNVRFEGYIDSKEVSKGEIEAIVHAGELDVTPEGSDQKELLSVETQVQVIIDKQMDRFLMFGPTESQIAKEREEYQKYYSDLRVGWVAAGTRFTIHDSPNHNEKNFKTQEDTLRYVGALRSNNKEILKKIEIIDDVIMYFPGDVERSRVIAGMNPEELEALEDEIDTNVSTHIKIANFKHESQKRRNAAKNDAAQNFLTTVIAKLKNADRLDMFEADWIENPSNVPIGEINEILAKAGVGLLTEDINKDFEWGNNAAGKIKTVIETMREDPADFEINGATTLSMHEAVNYEKLTPDNIDEKVILEGGVYIDKQGKQYTAKKTIVNNGKNTAEIENAGGLLLSDHPGIAMKDITQAMDKARTIKSDANRQQQQLLNELYGQAKGVIKPDRGPVALAAYVRYIRKLDARLKKKLAEGVSLEEAFNPDDKEYIAFDLSREKISESEARSDRFTAAKVNVYPKVTSLEARVIDEKVESITQSEMSLEEQMAKIKELANEVKLPSVDELKAKWMEKNTNAEGEYIGQQSEIPTKANFRHSPAFYDWLLSSDGLLWMRSFEAEETIKNLMLKNQEPEPILDSQGKEIEQPIEDISDFDPEGSGYDEEKRIELDTEPEIEARDFDTYMKESRFDQVIGGFILGSPNAAVPTMQDWNPAGLPMNAKTRAAFENLKKQLTPEVRAELLKDVAIASREESKDFFKTDDFRWGEVTRNPKKIWINYEKLEEAGATKGEYEDDMIFGESLHFLKDVKPELYDDLYKTAMADQEFLAWGKRSYSRERKDKK